MLLDPKEASADAMRAAIVCGPRNGTGPMVVHTALTALRGECIARIPRFDYFVVGSYRGTDREAFEWGIEEEAPVLICPARWNTGLVRGPAEGPRRNSFMLKWVKPVLVLGFPGGPGTDDMMSRACRACVPTYWWSLHDELWLRDERGRG